MQQTVTVPLIGQGPAPEDEAKFKAQMNGMYLQFTRMFPRAAQPMADPEGLLWPGETVHDALARQIVCAVIASDSNFKDVVANLSAEWAQDRLEATARFAYEMTSRMLAMRERYFGILTKSWAKQDAPKPTVVPNDTPDVRPEA